MDDTMIGTLYFLRPWWALLLLPAVILAVIYRKRTGQVYIPDTNIAPHLLAHLHVKHAGKSQYLTPFTLACVICAIAVLILMGPSWRQQLSPLSEDQHLLIVAIDSSQSMQQNDVQPSRLARAKYKIRQLLDTRRGSKTALMVYASSAHIALPASADTELLATYLDAIKIGITPTPGKRPERILTPLKQLSAQTKGGVSVVLVTDGPGENSDTALRRYFRDSGQQLLVWAVGTGGAPIPLETTRLKRLASDSGGQYIPLTADDNDIAQINRLIKRHYAPLIDNDALPREDSGYWLVFPCLLMLLIWGRRGWRLRWPTPAAESASTKNGMFALAIFAVFSSLAISPQTRAGETTASERFINAWLTPDQQGYRQFQQGNYAMAAQRFANHQWKAVALYYSGDFMLAAHYFSRSDTTDALYNQANARAQIRDYVPALALYDEVLAHDSDYPGAANNRERVQELVDEINALSAGQRPEGNIGSPDMLVDDAPMSGDGANSLDFSGQRQNYNAESILNNHELRAMWLKTVDRDPGEFLKRKFAHHLREATP